MSYKYSFTKEELEEAYREAGSVRGAAELLGIHHSTFLRHAKRLGVKIADVKNQYEREKQKQFFKVIDRNIGELDFEEMFDAVIKVQKMLDKHDIMQERATVNVNTDSPVLLVPIGDIHIGNRYVDYEALKRHIEILSKAENVLIILNGDLVDNYNTYSHDGGSHEAVMPLHMQKEFTRKCIDKIKDKIVAMVHGCHEAWSWNSDNFDFIDYLARENGAAYLGHGGVLQLNIGKARYKIVVRHKYRYNSSFNMTHTCKRLLEQYEDGDIAIVGHNHSYAIELTKIRGEEKVLIRLGSYKIHDWYTMKWGYRDADPVMPAVLLDNREKKMMIFRDFEQGIEYQRRLK